METVGISRNRGVRQQQADGTPRKLLDVTRMSSVGWSRRTPLREGLSLFYKAFLKTGSRKLLDAAMAFMGGPRLCCWMSRPARQPLPCSAISRRGWPRSTARSVATFVVIEHNMES